MPKTKKKIWNLTKNESEKSADLVLYGTIGSDDYWDDITDKDFKNELMALGDDVESINLYINSPGGGVTAATAIGNTLKAHKATTTAYIDGIAASAATIITCCCDVVKMPKNALFMIHNPLTIAWGEKKDFQKSIEILDKCKDAIVETYLSKASIDREKLSELMDNESWLNAEEAKAYGFVDEIIGDIAEPQNFNNMLIINNLAFDMSKFKNYPKSVELKVENKAAREEITVDSLKNDYPEIFSNIKNQGVLEERQRLKEIDGLNILDHAEIVDSAKYETPKNASELALELVKLVSLEKKNLLKEIVDESNGNNLELTPEPENKKNQGVILGCTLEKILSYMNKKTKGE